MKMQNGDSVCDVDRHQIDIMKASGWNMVTSEQVALSVLKERAARAQAEVKAAEDKEAQAIAVKAVEDKAAKAAADKKDKKAADKKAAEEVITDKNTADTKDGPVVGEGPKVQRRSRK